MEEATQIIEKCHGPEYGGYYGTFRTHAKIWQSGFYWRTMYQDTQDFIKRCERCQQHGNINTRDVMPLTNNLHVELFDVWGVDGSILAMSRLRVHLGGSGLRVQMG